ncbi:MAG TPA: amino acid permease [Saprospiraceae bacterium]|nr:amino acid permease [Saprospiraceae bacterium]
MSKIILAGTSTPKTFSLIKSTSVLIGMVVGTGIFSFPPMIAISTQNTFQFLMVWLIGGFISLMGGLSYVALSSIYPNSGGEYSYLKETYGKGIGFSFAWARMIVIQTGSIAIIAYIFGDYATAIFDMGIYSASIYAFMVIILFTLINIWGTKYAQNTQVGLTAMIVFVFIALIIFTFYKHPVHFSEINVNGRDNFSFGEEWIGPAFIFVLLTFGGWNETSYLAGEMDDFHKNMIKTLVYGILSVTIIYIGINMAFIQVLSFEGLKSSKIVGFDFTNKLIGTLGSQVMVFLIIICALSTLNASIITGARTNFILGNEYAAFKFMGKWSIKNNAPVQALIAQCIIALVFVFVGLLSQERIRTIVNLTAPVFWFFIILIILSIFILRKRGKFENTSFSKPIFLVPPFLFLGASLYLFYSSIKFTGILTIYGIGIVLLAIPIYLISNHYDKN